MASASAMPSPMSARGGYPDVAVGHHVGAARRGPGWWRARAAIASEWLGSTTDMKGDADVEDVRARQS
eukprot:4165811-Pyramimonas_sp.AAC.1